MTRLVSFGARGLALAAVCAAGAVSACAAGGATGASAGSSAGASAGSSAGASAGSGTGTLSATSIGATTPQPPARTDERVRPRVDPRAGGVHAVFAVALTTRHDLGVHGVRSADYRVTVARRGGASPGATCASVQTSILRRGDPGRRTSVALRPGPRGWCRGYYTGVIRFESGPACSGASKTMCPEFASQSIIAGRFAFRVR